MSRSKPQNIRSTAAAGRSSNAEKPGAISDPVKAPAHAGWQSLFGAFYDIGVTIEWNEFTMPTPLDWGRSFYPQSLELCLNVKGRGFIRTLTGAMDFEPGTAGFYLSGKDELEAWRQPREEHHFLTVKFSADYLRHQLAACDGALHPLVEGFLNGELQNGVLGTVFPISLDQEVMIRQMLQPPVFQGARPLWYQSKILQLMADFCFARRGEDELFCDRQKRLAQERVARVANLLRQRLAEPPTLEEIGRLVGCSPFYLSRTFSSEMRMTIPQYLRKVRIEHAAALLKSGRYNVTQAAMEVGYSSLSHFSQAFCHVMGCCPALYPLGGRKDSLPSTGEPSAPPCNPAPEDVEK